MTDHIVVVQGHWRPRGYNKGLMLNDCAEVQKWGYGSRIQVWGGWDLVRMGRGGAKWSCEYQPELLEMLFQQHRFLRWDREGAELLIQNQ